MITYFLFAGESSADLHGSRLIQALQLQEYLLSSICGVGGPRMRQESFECLIPMEEFQVMGFSDVVHSLPRLWKLFYQVRDWILKIQPDCVILIDYPGFNLRLAQALRKQGFKGKIVQYICPTVWAHGKKRVEILNAYYDLLITIFPFEAAYFAHTQLKVEYMGHPLVETIRTHPYQADWAKKMGLPLDGEWIALFPGSRPGEIQKHVPQQLQVAAYLKHRYPHLRFALSCAQESLKQHLLTLIQQNPLRLNEDLYIVPPQYNYDLMRMCKTALAKSGTVTLELAIHQVPTVVHYELSLLNYFFAKYVLRLRLPHYCIVNILSQATIFPEFIGHKLKHMDIEKGIENIHFDPIQHQQVRQACETLKQQLGAKASYQYAARAIQDLIK